MIAITAVALASIPVVSARAGAYKESGVLLSKLKETKHSLANGVKQAEQSEGAAVSAKFEMEGDELSLSVYTAKQGRGEDAEHNTLEELSGDPTKDAWTPKTEVFADKEHIARASMHLTIMQLSKLSLVDVITKVEADHPGTVYSAIPAVRGGMPVVDVLVATPEGGSVRLTVDLRSGKVSG
jgi:hypothetical protein